MSTKIRRQLLFLCLIFSFCCGNLDSSIADDKAVVQLSPDEARFRVGQLERIKVLVEMLASKNTASPGGHNFPENYDKQAQANVYLAIESLLNEGTAAFDTLIDHFEDERYAYTYDSPDDYHNRNVNQVCYQIIKRNVACYEFEIDLLTADQHSLVPWHSYEFKDVANWWKVNKNRPLWELQIEAIDQAIDFFKTVDRDKARSPLPSEDLDKLSPTGFEKVRSKNLEKLRSMRDNIARSKEPFRPKTIDTPFGSMCGLSWPIKVISK